VVLFPRFWPEAISKDAVFGLGHVLMVPAMAGVTLPRRHNPPLPEGFDDDEEESSAVDVPRQPVPVTEAKG
jgi:hypothetical protein